MNRNDSQEDRLAKLLSIKQQALKLIESEGFSARLPNIGMKEEKVGRECREEPCGDGGRMRGSMHLRQNCRFRLTSSFRTRPIPPKKVNFTTISNNSDLLILSKSSNKPLTMHPQPTIKLVLTRKHKSPELMTFTDRLNSRIGKNSTPYPVNQLQLDEVEDFMKSSAIVIKEKDQVRVMINKTERERRKQIKEQYEKLKEESKLLQLATPSGRYRDRGLSTSMGRGGRQRNTVGGLNQAKKKSEYKLTAWDHQPVAGVFETLD